MEKTSSARRLWIWLFLSAFIVTLACVSSLTTQAGSEGLTLTVLYDNIPFDKNLQTHWGFSCLLEKGSTRVLFDTGAQAEILLSNLKILKLDISSLDAIVFSHIHADHTAGYRGLRSEVITDPPVYVVHSFPAAFKQEVKVIEVSDPILLPNRDFRTTGEVPGQPANEQALIVKTERGLVVVTGCAHPGVVEIVRRVREISGEKIDLLIGGFHLLTTPAPEVEKIAKELRALGVAHVAPSHCTGEPAIEKFKQVYGADFIASGVGKVLRIDGTAMSD